MENKNQPAYPNQPTFDNDGRICDETWAAEGLTKRELIAAMCLQGLLASLDSGAPVIGHLIADTSIRMADELLTQLEKGD